MTPDLITTAREALKSLLKSLECKWGTLPNTAFTPEMHITAALDYAEKLKAERDEARLSWQQAADGWTQTSEGLSVAQHLIATLFPAIEHGDEEHRAWLKDKIDKHFSACNQGAYISERDRLTSQLDQAENAETRMAYKVASQQAQLDLYKAALEMIAGVRMCPDNLMGNVDIAREVIKDRQAKGERENPQWSPEVLKHMQDNPIPAVELPRLPPLTPSQTAD